MAMIVLSRSPSTRPAPDGRARTVARLTACLPEPRSPDVGIGRSRPPIANTCDGDGIDDGVCIGDTDPGYMIRKIR